MTWMVALLISVLHLPLPALAQKSEERALLGIRKLSSDKKSIFLEEGTFHHGAPKRKSEIKKIDRAYHAGPGYERLVFGLTTDLPPRIYGNISGAKKKLYLDFFHTNVSPGLSDIKGSKYIKSLSFFPLNEDFLSVELDFNESVAVEIFYLVKPARVVIDIKKS